MTIVKNKIEFISVYKYIKSIFLKIIGVIMFIVY